jgi:hypothetical protein
MTNDPDRQVYCFTMWRGVSAHSRESVSVLTPARVDGYSLHGYESARAAAHVALRAALRTGEDLGMLAPPLHTTWVNQATLQEGRVYSITGGRDGEPKDRLLDGLPPNLVVLIVDGELNLHDDPPIPLVLFLREWCPLEQFTGGEPWGPYAEGGDDDAETTPS